MPGDYTAKMMIDPAASTGIESIVVDVRNSDGKSMAFSSKRWGTKLTVSFTIDSETPDGLSVIDMVINRRNRPPVRERLSFWTVK